MVVLYTTYTHTHFTRDAEEKKNKWRREMMKQTISSGWGNFLADFVMNFTQINRKRNV